MLTPASVDDAAEHGGHQGKRVRKRGAGQPREEGEEAEQSQRARDREDPGKVRNKTSAAMRPV